MCYKLQVVLMEFVSETSLRWNSLYDHFIRIYRTFQQFNVQVPLYAVTGWFMLSLLKYLSGNFLWE